MAGDIAELGIVVDSSGVEKAKVSLDDLAQAGERAEQSAQGVGDAWSGVGQKAGAAAGSVGGASNAFKAGNESIRQQQAELGKLLGQIDPVVAALDRLDKQEQQLRGFKAAGALDSETFDQFNSRIQQSRNALSVFDDSLAKTGVSAGQTRQALRQLPAQFSDIFISLQSGQSPLTVFLQQGAQIKDSFGGAGAALRETGKFALGLVNPLTVAAAAAVALGVAWKQGSDEAIAFNKAIILTGNSAGVSSEQLSNLAAEIDQVAGTQRQAAAALVEVTQSGKFTADQFREIATAAVAFENATGQAVSKTIDEFERLADEPAEASAKLNDQYNFLTASVYAQIAALEEQGRTTEAAKLAIETYGEALRARSEEIDQNLGIIETGWKTVKNAAAEAWDEMLGIGRPETLEDQIKDLETAGLRLGDIASRGAVLGPVGALKEIYDQIDQNIRGATEEGREQLAQKKIELQLQAEQRDTEAAYAAERAAANEKAIAAQAFLNDGLKNARTNAEKLAAEYKKIDDSAAAAAAEGVAFSQAQIDQLKAAAAERFKDREPARTRAPRAAPAVRDDAATKLLLNLREQQSALELQLSTEEKLTNAENERAKFLQQIADLQSKDILTAEQKSLLSAQDSIKAQLDKNVAIEREIALRDEALKFQDRVRSVEEAINAGNQARRDQQIDLLGTSGLGKREREIKESFDEIRKEYARYKADLAEDQPADVLNSQAYRDAVAKIDASLNQSLENQRKYYEKEAELRGNARAGFQESVADYISDAEDLNSQVNDLTSSALGGLEDAFVDLATTGKANFKDLADSIISDIIRIGTRLLIAEALQSFGGGSTGVGGGGGSGSDGQNIGGLITSVIGLFGGGRANGGPVSSGRIYEVGENNMPELLMAGGKQYLIPGNDGNVVPSNKMGRAGNAVTIGNIDMSGVRDRREAREAAATVARQIGRVVGGSGRYA